MTETYNNRTADVRASFTSHSSSGPDCRVLVASPEESGIAGSGSIVGNVIPRRHPAGVVT
jgi:hypothetical protein